MKRILVPFLGLFALILLTPFILSKIMNSNIDNKISEFQKQGYQIKEVKKDIGYLSTKREFLVSMNDKLKKKCKINDIEANVILSFKNLPVTTANFNVEFQKLKLFNQTILNGYKFNLKTKDLKHFKLVGEDYNKNDLKISGVNGNLIIDKFVTKNINIKTVSYKDNLKIDNLKLNLIMKSYEPLAFEGEYNLTSFEFNYQNIKIKVENGGEKFKNSFLKEYKFIDKFKVKKFGVLINKDKYAVANLEGDFNSNYDKNFTKFKINTNFDFLQSEYKNKVLDGAEFNITSKIKLPADIFADVKIKIDKDLFESVTSELNPEVVNKYFKNYKTHFIFNNGEIKPYEN